MTKEMTKTNESNHEDASLVIALVTAWSILVQGPRALVSYEKSAEEGSQVLSAALK